MLEMCEMLDQFYGQRFLLLVHYGVLLAELLLVEGQDAVQVEGALDVLLEELDDGLLLAKAACEHLDDADGELGVDEGLDVEFAEELEVAQSVDCVHPGVLAQLNQELEVKHVQHIALPLGVDELPEQGFKQELDGYGGVLAEHDCEVGEDEFAYFLFLVVLDEEEDEFLVEDGCDLVLGVGQEVQEVEEAEQGRDLDGVDVLAGVPLELLDALDQQLLGVVLVHLRRVVLPQVAQQLQVQDLGLLVHRALLLALLPLERQLAVLQPHIHQSRLLQHPLALAIACQSFDDSEQYFEVLLLVVDGPLEVYFEEVVECVADEGEEEGGEVVDQVGVPLESHVEEVEAHALLAEYLVDEVLGVVLEALLDHVAEQFAALPRHLYVRSVVPESREIRLGLMRSKKNSVFLSGFFSHWNISLGSSPEKVSSMPQISAKLFLMPLTTMCA